MAKPRIFISSTFYDLRQIRIELDKFIESMGYDPVRNEEGDIPYGKDDELQMYCYKEIDNIDILISVIGGRYGSPSVIEEKEKEYSVSQRELKTAYKQNKQIFIFIEKNVYTEYETYVLNKDNSEIVYRYIDNINIYKFIDEIKSFSHNNNIKTFETVDDITRYLKEQFAGLFKQYIIDAENRKQQQVIQEVNETAQTLKQMLDYLINVNNEQQEGLKGLSQTMHPIIKRLKELLQIPYKFYIEGIDDFDALLNARSFKRVADCRWKHTKDGIVKELVIDPDLFQESGRLRYIPSSDWKDDFIQLEDKKENWETTDLPF